MSDSPGPSEHRVGKKSCPCPPCQVKHLRATKRWKLRVSRGEPIWGDIEAVRAHVQRLGRLGMGKHAVAAKAGVSSSTMSHLFYHFSRQGRTERITYRVAHRLLSVRFDVRAIAAATPLAKVDSSGARRRLQALVVAGWTVTSLADRAGMNRQQMRRYFFLSTFSARLCVRFIDLFEELWLTSPPKISAYSDARRRAMVKKNGWVGIGAWDDDTIDDPDAKPNLRGDENPTVDPEKVRRVLDGREKFSSLNAPERVELARLWDEAGRTKTAFEKRFGVSGATSARYFRIAVPDYQRKSA